MPDSLVETSAGSCPDSDFAEGASSIVAAGGEDFKHLPVSLAAYLEA